MNKIVSIKNKTSKSDIAAIAFIAFAFIYLVFFAFSGGTFADEAFYSSIPLRLINGDGLFTDEWHLSQLSSVLLYIPVRLFLMFTGSTEGMLVYMRLLFCLMQLATGILLYRTLRKDFGYTAIIISVSYMTFFTIGINTLSYNTIGISSLLTLICLLYQLQSNPTYIKMFFAGFLIAVFILCQPFGVFFYLAYFIAVCIFFIKNNKDKAKIPFPFTLKSLCVSIAGILPVLIFFLYLLFRNSELETIIKCIPGILDDIEHMQVSENIGIETFSLASFFNDMTMCAGLIPLVIFTICAVSAFALRKKDKSISFLATVTGFAILSLVFFFRLLFMRDTTETDDIYFFYFALALPGILFYILSEKKNKSVFILFWCTGITYALFMTVSSNMRLHASVNGYIISAAGTLLLAKEAYDELQPVSKEDKIKKITSLALAAVIFGFSIFNCTAVNAGSSFSRLSFRSIKMTEGIYKGISLPNNQALIYTRALRDAEEMEKILSPEDKLFVVENMSAVYLEGNFNMGAFSGWFICEQLQYPEIRNRFRNYYSIFPENIPDYIYVPSYRYSNDDGPVYVTPKMRAEFAYSLFEGEHQKLHDGLLIKVTGIKDE